MATQPAYKYVYQYIKKDIKEGRYKPGTILPTESQLEENFSVSRTTIRKAVSMLVADGFVRPKQGYGTEVLDFSTTQRLNHLTSITETLRTKGYKVTTKGMDIRRIKAPQHVSEALEIPANNMVYMVQRVQWADNRPIAIMVNYLKETAVPSLEKHIGTFTGLYAFLENHYHLILKSAWERISATSAEFTEAQILQIPIGAPLLCSKRISYVESGPVEFGITKLVGDKYEFSVYLEGRK